MFEAFAKLTSNANALSDTLARINEQLSAQFGAPPDDERDDETSNGRSKRRKVYSSNER